MHRQEIILLWHRKESAKLASSPLQFTFNKKKNEKLQKIETCIFEDVGTLTKINV